MFEAGICTGLLPALNRPVLFSNDENGGKGRPASNRVYYRRSCKIDKTRFLPATLELLSHARFPVRPSPVSKDRIDDKESITVHIDKRSSAFARQQLRKQ
jgi:hypothetical protein